MSTAGAPSPVAWDAEREARGATGSHLSPRCTVPGCPVRYRDPPDRPCREHRRDEEVRPWEVTVPAPPRRDDPGRDSHGADDAVTGPGTGTGCWYPGQCGPGQCKRVHDPCDRNAESPPAGD